MTSRNKNYLLTGMITVLPVFLTAYITLLISRFLSKLSAPLLVPIFNRYVDVRYADALIFVTGIILTICSIWMIGVIMTNFFGRKLFSLFDALFARIPVLKNIYISIRRLVEHLTATKIAFRQVGLVEYPRKGIYSIGFVTSETWQEIQNVIPEDVINVFVPTTPNPTSGVLIMVPKAEFIFLKMTTDEAFFFIMSGGIVTPGSAVKNGKAG